jgi:hypothetical protein
MYKGCPESFCKREVGKHAINLCFLERSRNDKINLNCFRIQCCFVFCFLLFKTKFMHLSCYPYIILTLYGITAYSYIFSHFKTLYFTLKALWSLFCYFELTCLIIFVTQHMWKRHEEDHQVIFRIVLCLAAFVFWAGLGVNSGHLTCNAGTLLLEACSRPAAFFTFMTSFSFDI